MEDLEAADAEEVKGGPKGIFIGRLSSIVYCHRTQPTKGA